MEFRGLHDDNEENMEQRYFEFGAHFRYKDLVETLKYLQGSQLAKKEKDKENSINIKNNSNYNEVYNQINKQLCQKMTDIIPPNKFIQSRNIKPLIQSLSQKLTDIIQSQNNKKPMRQQHLVFVELFFDKLSPNFCPLLFSGSSLFLSFFKYFFINFFKKALKLLISVAMVKANGTPFFFAYSSIESSYTFCSFTKSYLFATIHNIFTEFIFY